MASPQTKNGYTRIANEILEKIAKTDLNGTQLRIVMVIWRYTYGFSRKEYEISLAFLAEAIDTLRGHVDRELTNLINRKIINVVGIGKRRGRILSFNKNYEEWSDRPVNQIEEPAPPPKIVKPTKEAKAKYTEDNSYYRMALYFYKRVSIVAKDAGVGHLIAKANLQSWADDFRKLVELDKVDKQLAKDVMDWVTQDPFWRTNVLSAKKLREKFTDLAIKMKSQSTPKQAPFQPQRDIRDKEIEFQRWMQEGNDPDAFNWRN
ncbi:replication protein [Cytobacillus oceanisediminis]|uniref:replication protein n=1 Tax=Cytobacillus oceanisediminis TaxID=665099 RepID=UPI00207A7A06|nr:replication protein [Cytobacillus oceanisediminis]USK46321.1 replication protein [Cytobacillus oceanisediminis]